MPEITNERTLMLFKNEISAEFAQQLCEDADKVLEFVSQVKWKDGFVCRNCNHTNYCEGKTPFQGVVRVVKKKNRQRLIPCFIT